MSCYSGARDLRVGSPRGAWCSVLWLVEREVWCHVILGHETSWRGQVEWQWGNAIWLVKRGVVLPKERMNFPTQRQEGAPGWVPASSDRKTYVHITVTGLAPARERGGETSLYKHEPDVRASAFVLQSGCHWGICLYFYHLQINATLCFEFLRVCGVIKLELSSF